LGVSFLVFLQFHTPSSFYQNFTSNFVLINSEGFSSISIVLDPVLGKSKLNIPDLFFAHQTAQKLHKHPRNRYRDKHPKTLGFVVGRLR
jgi:hypothetical protein